MRGGGPLTTLVDPRIDKSSTGGPERLPLWKKLWANVETRSQWAARTPRGAPESISSAFPWLRPTRTSGKHGGSTTTPGTGHPLEAYFGLPRRIRLEFAGPGRCELTDEMDDVTVSVFRMRNYGVQYEAWRHPLSPYYRSKPETAWLSLHGQAGGVGWRDWVTLTLRAPVGALREPAAAVAAFYRRASDLGLGSFRLHAFGYDMDNMKARGWIEAELPSFVVDNDERLNLLYQFAAALTDANGMAATALVGSVKTALFQSSEDAAGDFTQVRTDIWHRTERAFYEAIAAIATAELDLESSYTTASVRKQEFAQAMAEAALEIFDRWAPASGVLPAVLRRRVTARHDLLMALRGYSTLGERIFTALEIPLPGGGRAARKQRGRKEKTPA
jgi:CRISPR system Cascade subunit CasA